MQLNCYIEHWKQPGVMQTYRYDSVAGRTVPAENEEFTLPPMRFRSHLIDAEFPVHAMRTFMQRITMYEVDGVPTLKGTRMQFTPPNAYSDGRICWNARNSRNHIAQDISQAIASFAYSPFNSDLGGLADMRRALDIIYNEEAPLFPEENAIIFSSNRAGWLHADAIMVATHAAHPNAWMQLKASGVPEIPALRTALKGGAFALPLQRTSYMGIRGYATDVIPAINRRWFLATAPGEGGAQVLGQIPPTLPSSDTPVQ
ncbi:MAG: hypothetical protein WBM08_14925 [Prochlorococcaceae cyanobacterium]